jgi:hypothetical protein
MPPNCLLYFHQTSLTPKLGMKYSKSVIRTTMTAHSKRKLVLNEIELLKCKISSAKKLIGGPGTKGAKQPTNPNIKKTKPISTITTSELITAINQSLSD